MSVQSLQARAASIFSQQEAFEIFASFGGNKEDIEILTNYQNINALQSRTEKHDAFGKLSPINKSNFWRVQMLLSIAANSNLNVEQQNLILETMASINPELYAKDDSKLKIKRERLLPLKEKIMKAFPEDVRVPIFSMIGDGEIVPDEGVFARCHCLKDSRFSSCGINSTCGKGSACNDSPNNGTNCGFLNLDYCDGRCG